MFGLPLGIAESARRVIARAGLAHVMKPLFRSGLLRPGLAGELRGLRRTERRLRYDGHLRPFSPRQRSHVALGPLGQFRYPPPGDVLQESERHFIQVPGRQDSRLFQDFLVSVRGALRQGLTMLFQATG